MMQFMMRRMKPYDIAVGLLGFSAIYLLRNVAATSLWWLLWLLIAGSVALYYL